ncbi:MAG: PD-(D/E)XK nuclease family protein [Anaerolineales bacterium]|jgi:CRISPR/Cas system-associated exonuclease Cas4 (RecB family)|nr:PD-(D/E)XK nuclease family protein [Anaerolineales bacterium]
MKFPPEFQFTQGNLQNFLDCRRRFYLGSIRQLAWPAVPTEPMAENERLSQQGAAFHRLIQQYFLHVPEEVLLAQAQDEPLYSWFNHFLAARSQLPGISEAGVNCLPEYNLTAFEGGARAAVKYDLLAILPDSRLYIYDWKTSRVRPRAAVLANRMQTRLYRYLLYKLSASLVKHPVQPEQVSMVYWYANFPNEPEIFPYSARQLDTDRAFLQQTIQTIRSLVENDKPEQPGLDFPMTLHEKSCAYCVYRSLCERGVEAGDTADLILDEVLAMEDAETRLTGLDLSLDQIAEIEF